MSLSPLSQAQTQQPSHAKVLGQRLKCMCGGCGDTASACNHTGGAFSGPCDTAKGMLKEANDRISGGSSDDLVLQSFVQEYGPTVLIEPPKAGFNLLAWIMPIVVPICRAHRRLGRCAPLARTSHSRPCRRPRYFP